ncbi:MAG: hypothetical protein GX049_05205 [Alcaligenaceae bacterium]|nr:hypothetical protein [Alcaligenaceae bacterium]
MLYAALKTLHLVSIIVWVGGMVFAHFYLRPAVAGLNPPERLRLMNDVLGRFFRDVLGAALITLATGLWMIGRIAKATVQAGGQFSMPLDWTLMSLLGSVMVIIFLVIRFRFYPQLARSVADQSWQSAGAALARIRSMVSLNLALGTFIVVFTLLY